jgi:hypothetical protein
MPKRIKHKKRPTDVNELRQDLVAMSTQDDRDSIPPPTKEQVSAFMSAMGRKGGKIGGKKRLQTMTAEERSAVARNAARVRWKK